MIEFLIQQNLCDFKAQNILDVGPGYSHFSRVVAQTTGATQITYIDGDSKVLQWQTQQCHQVGLTPECLLMHLVPSHFAKFQRSYDVVLCQEVLEHLSKAEAILEILARQLTPQGRMVITVPTKISEQWLKWLNPAYMRDEPFGHVRQFDEATLRQMVQAVGLKPLAFIPTQPHYFVGHTWLFGSRMQVQGSSGDILTKGWRRSIFVRLVA